MKSLKKNFVYNILYQLLLFIIPVISTPYVSRTLGAECVGIYGYTYSIVYYFMLLTMLGINNYGNRCIAKVRDDKEELSKKFWGIYAVQLIMRNYHDNRIFRICFYFRQSIQNNSFNSNNILIICNC